MKNLLAVLAFLLTFQTVGYAHHTVLHTAAQNLQAGEWVEISTLNFQAGQFLETGTTVPGPITQWADSACWDHVRRQFKFIGSPHYLPSKFVIYTESTNTWTSGPLYDLANTAEINHASDDHNACNRTSGDMYTRHYGTFDMRKFASSTETWSVMPPFSQVASSQQVATGMVHFPDRDELFLVDGDWGTYKFSLSTNTWTRLSYGNGGGGTPQLTMGAYNVIAEYNPVHKTVLFGGGLGSHKIYKYDINGAITQLNDAPIAIGLGRTLVQTDPVSGKYLVWGDDVESGKTFWEYDISSDQWTPLSIANIPWMPYNPATFDTIMAPIYDYGVLFVVKWKGSLSRVYLYKHASSEGSFASRCAAPGVIRCMGFDSAAEITGTWGVNPVGSINGSLTGPSIDTSVKASGSGSLHFVIPSNSGDNSSGTVFVNFSDDYQTQFGEGQEFYVQFRQRFSSNFINTIFNLTGGEGGWKQAIIGQGSTSSIPKSSCTPLEVVLQNSAQKGMVQGYHSCVFFQGFTEYYPPLGVYKLQNAIPDPYCFTITSPNGTTQAPPPCEAYHWDEWMTFQVHVQIGNYNSPNSLIEVWVSREGGAERKIIDMQGYTLCFTDTSCATQNMKYGQVWLLPYHTGKDPAQTHLQGDVWYDELIISTNKIANPSGGMAAQASRKMRSRGKSTFLGNVKVR